MTVARTNPMKKFSSCAFVSFVVGLLFLVSSCGGPPKHPTWNNATGAEQYERLMWQSIKSGDWKNVEYRLAPTFVGVDSAGQSYDRAGWLEHWKQNPVAEFSLAEVNVLPQGHDMVVTYVLQLSVGAAQGSGAARSLRVVSVWQQVKRGWILTATSETPMS
jgi:hypothetical protein